MISKPQGFCYDVEADDLYLYATKVWYVRIKDLNDPSKTLCVLPFQDADAGNKLRTFAEQYENPFIVFHNGLGYDVFMTLRHLDLDFNVGADTFCGRPCQFFDTWAGSMFTAPDQEAHSLEFYGNKLGLPKIDWRQKAIDIGLIDSDAPRGAEFKQWHPEMGVYCDRDVDANIKTFWCIWNRFEKQYGLFTGKMPMHYNVFQKNFYLMSCQELTGWEFDIPAAQALKLRIEQMQKEIADDVEPKLPPRKLKKSEENLFSMPLKPYKRDGTLSSHMLKFIEKHNGKVLTDKTADFFGVEYEIKGNAMLDVKLPMLLGNQDDLKDWFLTLGWVPTFYNFKKDKQGKPERDPKTKQYIQTTPKIQDVGKLCPNLEKLEGDIAKKAVTWLSLRNRLSVINGWLENPRLALDGRLPQGRSGITPTHREKHTVLANLPKASEKVLLGKEVRSLLCVKEGNVLVSVDMAGLEQRCEGSRTFKYDGGARAKVLIEGDAHSKNAKIFYPRETEGFDPDAPDFNKDDPKFKPYRDRSKNGGYALAYGCSAKKLASTLGKPEREAEALFEAYWEGNPSLGMLRDALTRFWETSGEKVWIPGIDGRRIFTRKKSALLNSLFQSDGAIAMQYALCFIDKKLGGICFDEDWKPCYYYKGFKIQRVGYCHDQADFECSPEIADELKAIVETCYAKAGEFLKFKVPLVGSGNIGKNLCEVH